MWLASVVQTYREGGNGPKESGLTGKCGFGQPMTLHSLAQSMLTGPISPRGVRKSAL